MLANAFADFVEAICHDPGYCDEVVDWAETAGGEVTLRRGQL